MADQPQQSPGFDPRKVIEQSAAKSTLQELARKGIHRVKVLDDQMIQKLIKDAVAQTLASKSDALSEADREKVVAASRQELDKLMKEFQTHKDKAELVEKDKEGLAAEVVNLERQLQIQRQLADTLGKQRFEDGRAAAKQEIDELKAKLASGGGDEAVKRAIEKRDAELKVRFQKYEAELKAEAQRKYDEGVASQRAIIDQLKLRAEEAGRLASQKYEAELKTEAQRKYDEGVASQKPVIEQLKIRAEEAGKRGSQEKELELNQRLMGEMQKNVELSTKLTKTLEDMRTRDDEVAKKMEQLFTKSIEGLSKKLGDLKFVAGPGGGGGGGGGEGLDSSFRQSEDVLKHMLSNELESNVKNMEKTEGKVAGNLGNALERLKAMRGGGAPPKKDDKKDEKK